MRFFLNALVNKPIVTGILATLFVWSYPVFSNSLTYHALPFNCTSNQVVDGASRQVEASCQYLFFVITEISGIRRVFFEADSNYVYGYGFRDYPEPYLPVNDLAVIEGTRKSLDDLVARGQDVQIAFYRAKDNGQEFCFFYGTMADYQSVVGLLDFSYQSVHLQGGSKRYCTQQIHVSDRGYTYNYTIYEPIDDTVTRESPLLVLPAIAGVDVATPSLDPCPVGQYFDSQNNTCLNYHPDIVCADGTHAKSFQLTALNAYVYRCVDSPAANTNFNNEWNCSNYPELGSCVTQENENFTDGEGASDSTDPDSTNTDSNSDSSHTNPDSTDPDSTTPPSTDSTNQPTTGSENEAEDQGWLASLKDFLLTIFNVALPDSFINEVSQLKDLAVIDNNTLINKGNAKNQQSGGFIDSFSDQFSVSSCTDYPIILVPQNSYTGSIGFTIQCDITQPIKTVILLSFLLLLFYALYRDLVNFLR